MYASTAGSLAASHVSEGTRESAGLLLHVRVQSWMLMRSASSFQSCWFQSDWFICRTHLQTGLRQRPSLRSPTMTELKSSNLFLLHWGDLVSMRRSSLQPVTAQKMSYVRPLTAKAHPIVPYIRASYSACLSAPQNTTLLSFIRVSAVWPWGSLS